MPHDDGQFAFLEEGSRVEVLLPPRPAELLRTFRGCAYGCALFAMLPFMVVGTVFLWEKLGPVALAPAGMLFVATLLAAHFGMHRLAGPPKVWLEAGRIGAEDRILFLRRRRSAALTEIWRFVVTPLNLGSKTEVGLLLGERFTGPPVLLVAGYELSVLHSLAQKLQDRLPEIAGRHGWAIGELAPVQTRSSSDLSVDLRPVPSMPHPKPEQSIVSCERSADDVTLTVPALGVWRGSSGIFPFGLLWTLATAGIALFVNWGKQVRFEPMMPNGFLLLLPAVGLILVGVGWSIGRRSAVLAKVGEVLMVLQVSPWRSKRFEWPVSEVATIDVGASSFEVNDQPLPQLRIQLKNGAEFNFLLGRSAEELAWIADELAVACGCFRPTNAPEGATGDEPPP